MIAVGDPSVILQRANIDMRSVMRTERDGNETGEKGCLDGSAAGMHQLLTELVGLASQTEPAHTAPVLELLLGEVLTRTSMCQRDGVECLLIVLILPPCDAAKLVPATLFSGDHFDAECLWHAEEGRYVIVRHLPIALFKDAVDVLDTIMAGSDRVTAWLASAPQLHLRTVSEAGR